jgi:hypothetical protein
MTSPDGSQSGGGERHRDERDLLVLFTVVMFVGITAAGILYSRDNQAFLYFGDGVSHLVKAREIVDSQDPGLHNIRTVWLPLPHLILLPFAMVDGLFYTGIAAPLAGIPMLIVTTLLLFIIVRDLTGLRGVAFAGALIYGLNPNVVYMALTPMSETPSWLFTAFGGYALLRWLKTDQTRWLILASGGVVLATLCRYETWFLAPLVTMMGVKRGWFAAKSRTARDAIPVISSGILSLAGIFAWFIWNWSEFGDPLLFARETYGIGGRPTIGEHPFETIGIYAVALMSIFGPALLFLCVAKIGRVLRAFVKQKAVPLLVFFMMPTFFVLVSVGAGFVEMNRWGWNWRYVLASAFFIIILASVGFVESFRSRRSGVLRMIVLAGLLLMPVFQMTLPAVGVATFREAVGGYRGESSRAIAFSRRLLEEYKGGKIALLCSYGLGHRIMIASGLPLKVFSMIPNPAETGITEAVWPTDSIVVIGGRRSPESGPYLDEWAAQKRIISRRYSECMEDGGFLLLKKRSQ